MVQTTGPSSTLSPVASPEISYELVYNSVVTRCSFRSSAYSPVDPKPSELSVLSKVDLTSKTLLPLPSKSESKSAETSTAFAKPYTSPSDFPLFSDLYVRVSVLVSVVSCVYGPYSVTPPPFHARTTLSSSLKSMKSFPFEWPGPSSSPKLSFCEVGTPSESRLRSMSPFDSASPLASPFPRQPAVSTRVVSDCPLGTGVTLESRKTNKCVPLPELSLAVSSSESAEPTNDENRPPR